MKRIVTPGSNEVPKRKRTVEAISRRSGSPPRLPDLDNDERPAQGFLQPLPMPPIPEPKPSRS